MGVFGTGDTVRFTSSPSPRTINLTSGELLLSRGATIAGPGPSLLTVSGNHASRVFEIAAGISVKLDGLTIANGTTGNGYGDAGKGGGILNSGTLIISNCILTGNSAYSGGGIFSTSILDMGGCVLTANASTTSGGGIQCSGTADLLSSMLSGNSADFDGGGIYSSGDLTVSNCTLTNNSARNNGGGIVNHEASLTVNDSSLDYNSAYYTGGGIYVSGGSLFGSVIRATISGRPSNNSAYAGGAIFNTEGTLILTGSTLNDNTASVGGAIYNEGSLSYFDGVIFAASILSMSNCSLSGNAAAFGGASRTSAYRLSPIVRWPTTPPAPAAAASTTWGVAIHHRLHAH